MAAETSPDTAPPTSPDLAGLRTRIDQLDAALIAIVAERLAICREVAAVKEGSATPVIQPERVRDVVTSRRQQAIEAGVDMADEKKTVHAARSAAQGGVNLVKPTTTIGTPNDGASSVGRTRSRTKRNATAVARECSHHVALRSSETAEMHTRDLTVSLD